MLLEANMSHSFIHTISYGEGVQQIQLRTEDRENGDLGAIVPKSGVLEAAVIWYKKFHFI